MAVSYLLVSLDTIHPTHKAIGGLGWPPSCLFGVRTHEKELSSAYDLTVSTLR